MITNNARFMQTREAQPPSRLTETISAAANRIYHDALIPKAAVPDPGPKMPDSLCGYYFLPPNKAKSGGRAPYDVAAVRRDFPILARKVNGHPLIWLDNSATTQKPQCVIDALSRYYSEYNSNIHRGAHSLARQATDEYERAREKVCRFIGAASTDEVVFVRGATEAINLVASSWGGTKIGPGDEIILTHMEHHSNIVPWQMLAKQTGAVIRVVPATDDGALDLAAYERLFTPRTRLVAVAHVSNVLGTVNPVRQMADVAHRHGAVILIDGAQAVSHMPISVQEMDADFYALSGHKMYGPTGIGVLYAKKQLLNAMPPYQGGGGMIRSVRFDQTIFQPPPEKFEAGTANIADAVGLGAAVDYLQGLGMQKVRQYEAELTRYLMEQLRRIPGLRLIGTAPEKTSVVSFILKGSEPDVIAQYLDQRGIAVRAGHHCAQPLLSRFGLNSTVRASIGVYNTFEEADKLAEAVNRVRQM